MQRDELNPEELLLSTSYLSTRKGSDSEREANGIEQNSLPIQIEMLITNRRRQSSSGKQKVTVLLGSDKGQIAFTSRTFGPPRNQKMNMAKLSEQWHLV
jgi:hypothetical protein